MSRTSRNFAIAYVLLVGLPLVGLAGVLRSGRNLTAPISLDGIWNIEADSNRLAAQPCAKTVLSASNSSLTISQSGKSLVLTFNNASKSTSSGIIEGQNLKAIFAPTQGSASCGNDEPLTLTATVDRKSEPRSLTGVLSVQGCQLCVPVGFRAVRLPRSQGGGAH